MKTYFSFLLGIIFIGLSQPLYAQKAIRIAYVDMQYILENTEYYQLAIKQLAVKAEIWKKDIEQKEQQIKNMTEALNYEKILLTKELIKEKEDKILFYQEELLDYQKKRFGTNGDYIIQQQKIVQPLQDKVFHVVNEIARERKYDIIFDKSADVVMLYSNKRLDVSKEVLNRLKISVRKEKNPFTKGNTGSQSLKTSN